MPDHIERARRLIVSRLDELGAERRRLEAALRSMGEQDSSKPRRGRPRKSAGARKPTAPRGRKAARAPRGQRRADLLTAIAANPGARPAELARQIGAGSSQVHALLAKLVAEKLIIKRDKGYVVKR
jgi:MarR family